MSNFSVSATAAQLQSGLVIQYGFSVTGPLAEASNEGSLGSVVLSAQTLSTKDNDLFESAVYPNPTVNTWTIDTPNTKIKTIELFNIIGKQVYSSDVDSNQAVIPTKNLTSGVYFAKVNTDAGTKSIKLIKE